MEHHCWFCVLQLEPLSRGQGAAGHGPTLPVPGELKIVAVGAIPIARTLLLVPHVLSQGQGWVDSGVAEGLSLSNSCKPSGLPEV